MEDELSERPVGRQIDGQPDVAGGCVTSQGMGHSCRQLPTDDLADEAVPIDNLLMGRHDRSVAHHDESIGDRLQFGEAMADVDHPDSPGTE